jgi:AcrR family transcriptional regulator
MSTADARQRILAVSMALFAQYGFRKTSIDDIARAARIGKGTVYLHFASKEAIFAEVVQTVGQRLVGLIETAVREAPDPPAKVRAFVRTRMALVSSLAQELAISQDAALELLPMADQQRKGLYERMLQLLEGVLEEGARAGVFHLARPRLLAVAIVACMQGLNPLGAVLRHAPDQAAVDEVLDVLLRGLMVRPSRRST